MKTIDWKYPPEIPEDCTYVIAQYYEARDTMPMILLYASDRWNDVYGSVNQPRRWVALPQEYLK